MLSTSQVAHELGCHPNTVKTYARRGLLPAFRDYRNYRLFRPEDVEQLKKRRNAVEPEKLGAKNALVEGG